jgi:hypothetical protein
MSRPESKKRKHEEETATTKPSGLSLTRTVSECLEGILHKDVLGLVVAYSLTHGETPEQRRELLKQFCTEANALLHDTKRSYHILMDRWVQKNRQPQPPRQKDFREPYQNLVPTAAQRRAHAKWEDKCAKHAAGLVHAREKYTQELAEYHTKHRNEATRLCRELERPLEMADHCRLCASTMAHLIDHYAVAWNAQDMFAPFRLNMQPKGYELVVHKTRAVKAKTTKAIVSFLQSIFKDWCLEHKVAFPELLYLNRNKDFWMSMVTDWGSSRV